MLKNDKIYFKNLLKILKSFKRFLKCVLLFFNTMHEKLGMYYYDCSQCMKKLRMYYYDCYHDY